jgi:hypothetical protein
MSVITSPQSRPAENERGYINDNTALVTPMIQLVMTYKGIPASCEASEELVSWLDARCEELGVCPMSFLLGCAEFVRDME